MIGVGLDELAVGNAAGGLIVLAGVLAAGGWIDFDIPGCASSIGWGLFELLVEMNSGEVASESLRDPVVLFIQLVNLLHSDSVRFCQLL